MEKDQLSRKLAVILHADVVDSTTLVRQDETMAHQRIQNAFKRFSQTISSHDGVAHEIRGDALVAEFPRVSDAVAASIEFQVENSAFIQDLPDQIRPEIRIGIAMGEVVIADNTVTGEGVVLAQRIEQMANPGGVLIQGAAYETVPKRLPFRYENLGEHELKGFHEAVRIFAVNQETESTTAMAQLSDERQTEEPTYTIEPSIAVLPFANLSGDPEQEWFSNGITEDITTTLSRISGLLVIGRYSTMDYKGELIDVRRIGQELGVQYVLEGSVRKAGNRIRVTAQLVDATTGQNKWADRYDRDLDDVFAVQDDITRNITIELRVKLSDGEKARRYAGGTSSVHAWERVVRADELNSRFIREDNQEARRLAEEALQLDPQYAAAWLELGWDHWEDAYFGWSDDREKSIGEAMDAAKKALELDEGCAMALGLIGYLYLLTDEHDRAVESVERASLISPSDSDLTALLGDVLLFTDRADDAAEVLKKAIQLSPSYPAWILASLGMCYYVIGKNDLAISTLQEAVRLEPDSALPRIYLTIVLAEAGRSEDARQAAQEIMRIDRHFSVKKWHGAQFKDANLKKRTLGHLLSAGLPE